jgi:hypothetical protein
VQFAPGAPWIPFRAAVVVPLLPGMISIKRKTGVFFKRKPKKESFWIKAGVAGCQGFREKSFTIKISNKRKNFFAGTRRA